MTETQLKNKVLKYLKEIPYCFVYKACDRFTSGIPDILCCIKGKFIAIELKVGDNLPTKIQRYIGQQIRLAGGICFIAYSLKNVKEQLTFNNIII